MDARERRTAHAPKRVAWAAGVGLPPRRRPPGTGAPRAGSPIPSRLRRGAAPVITGSGRNRCQRPASHTVVVSEPYKPSWLSEPSPVERLRHCWVTADQHGRLPALLLEWRQTSDGYEARVARRCSTSRMASGPREEWPGRGRRAGRDLPGPAIDSRNRRCPPTSGPFARTTVTRGVSFFIVAWTYSTSGSGT